MRPLLLVCLLIPTDEVQKGRSVSFSGSFDECTNGQMSAHEASDNGPLHVPLIYVYQVHRDCREVGTTLHHREVADQVLEIRVWSLG